MILHNGSSKAIVKVTVTFIFIIPPLDSTAPTNSYGGLNAVSSEPGSELVVVTVLALCGWLVAVVFVAVVVWLCYRRWKTKKILKRLVLMSIRRWIDLS